jgi:predicted nucleotidyltransferase
MSMNRDYILSLLAQYKKNNHDKYGIESIGIFGSVARDEATQSSDVDICIQTKTPDMFMLVHIKEELQNLFHKSVDIVRLRERMNPYLKKRIDKEAIYV